MDLTTLGYEDVPAPYSHAPTHAWNREYGAPLCGAKASVANCAQDATKVTCADCKRLLSPKDMAAQVDSLIARVLGLEGKVRGLEREAHSPADWQRNERDAQAMGEEIAKLVAERDALKADAPPCTEDDWCPDAQRAIEALEANLRHVTDCNEAMREPMRLLREAVSMPAEGEGAVVREVLKRMHRLNVEVKETNAELDRAGVLLANEAGGFPLVHRVRALLADRDCERATRTDAVGIISEARKAAGAPDGEPLTKAVERLVAERDEARREGDNKGEFVDRVYAALDAAGTGRDARAEERIASLAARWNVAALAATTLRAERDALTEQVEHLTGCNQAVAEERDHLRASMSAIGKGLIERKREPVESTPSALVVTALQEAVRAYEQAAEGHPRPDKWMTEWHGRAVHALASRPCTECGNFHPRAIYRCADCKAALCGSPECDERHDAKCPKRDPAPYAAGTVPGTAPACPSPGHCLSCSTPAAPSTPKACEGCINHRRDGNDVDTCMVWPPHLRPEPSRCSTYQATPAGAARP